jgi:hypothetical protein
MWIGRKNKINKVAKKLIEIKREREKQKEILINISIQNFKKIE